MHIHILGICGTFMGGLALLARSAGHHVTGCDQNVYPPMSTQLEEQGIQITNGYEASQIQLEPDLFIIGNAISRGNPLMEEIFNRGLHYQSGPQWIGEHILQKKWVLAVAGTHGKTTTSSMLAWILEEAGYSPGYLIGGIPLNFGISARLHGNNGETPFFVIEADEYDTAFFDKRSKFVHYHANTAIFNNLEFDHADIFPDLAAIERQFHHFVRTIPNNGKIICQQGIDAFDRVIEQGRWCELAYFSYEKSAEWMISNAQSQSFDVYYQNELQGRVVWQLGGKHNQLNALAAIAAAHHVGISPAQAIQSLSSFINVKRRMEIRGIKRNITVYDDFAHHPTAIATTIDGLRQRLSETGNSGRILAVLEPRSNTMKLGTMKEALPASLSKADVVFAFSAADSTQDANWNLAETLLPLGENAHTFSDFDALIDAIIDAAIEGDHILVMSNGGFGNIHSKIIEML